MVMEGYKWMFNNQLVDVWSAPNYWYDAAPHSERKEPSKNPPPDYFLLCVCCHLL